MSEKNDLPGPAALVRQQIEEALPDLDSLKQALALDLEAAKRETTTDWSEVPLWKVLATTTENPYGIKSKIGLRRLERAAKKRALHRRKPGHNLDGTKRPKRPDQIRARHNKYWKEVRAPSRKERLRTDPEYKFHTMKRMAKNWGIEWTLSFESFLGFWNMVLKDPKKDATGRKRKKPLHEFLASWQLRRKDTTKGWEEGNVEVFILKPKRRPKRKRLKKSKSKLPYGGNKSLGYVKPTKEKDDGEDNTNN